LSKIGLTTTLKNAWTTSRQVNFFWVANFNLKFGKRQVHASLSFAFKNLLNPCHLWYNKAIL
ncbi:hypothetical protein, partial [Streptococcus suis]|uniref:hypothetical protein n=1 Tax=Streptococcus suis TaxID=1307 RepID=UPI001C2E3945